MATILGESIFKTMEKAIGIHLISFPRNHGNSKNKEKECKESYDYLCSGRAFKKKKNS